jgi:hypothetical protein
MIPGSRPEANWTRVPCSGRAKCGIIVSGPFIACLPAAAAGAFYPVISEPVILAAYLLSWIACAATLVNDSNRSASALGGIFIWAIAAVSGAAAAGALAAHALWWWHQGYIAT